VRFWNNDLFTNLNGVFEQVNLVVKELSAENIHSM